LRMGEFILRPGAGVRPSANENDATKAQATRHRRTRRERHMATPHRHTQQANAATAQHRAQSREAPTALDAATEGRIRPGRFGQAPCQAQHAEERVISASRQHRWWKDGRQHDGQGHSEQRLRAGLKRRFRMQHLARGQGAWEAEPFGSHPAWLCAAPNYRRTARPTGCARPPSRHSARRGDC